MLLNSQEHFSAGGWSDLLGRLRSSRDVLESFFSAAPGAGPSSTSSTSAPATKTRMRTASQETSTSFLFGFADGGGPSSAPPTDSKHNRGRAGIIRRLRHRRTTSFALPPRRNNPNKDYISDLVDELWQKRAAANWTPAAGADMVWGNLAKGPHLGHAYIHLQYQSAEIYSTNMAWKSKPFPINWRETAFGGRGMFACADDGPFSMASPGTTVGAFGQTTKSFTGGNTRQFYLPSVTFRDGSFLSGEGRIRVQLTEKGMDGKPDRLLWDAIYDSRIGLPRIDKKSWEFAFMFPVGGTKKEMELPCTNKWDPRPHWFDMKFTSVAKFKPKEIGHWKEGWRNLGGRAAHIGFTVQRHPIMENPNEFIGLTPEMPMKMFMGTQDITQTPKRDYWQSRFSNCDGVNTGADAWEQNKCNDYGGKTYDQQENRSFMPRWPTEFERRLYKDADPNFYYSRPDFWDQMNPMGNAVQDTHGYYWWSTMDPSSPWDSMDDGRPPLAPPMTPFLGQIAMGYGGSGTNWLAGDPGYIMRSWRDPVTGKRQTFEKMKPFKGSFLEIG